MPIAVGVFDGEVSRSMVAARRHSAELELTVRVRQTEYPPAITTTCSRLGHIYQSTAQ